jgi:hypothetical protein
MAQNIEKLIVEVGAEIKDLKKKVKQINSEIGSVDKSVKKNADSWGTLQKGIGLAMAVTPVIAFGKSIVNTIAEFQKMEAVLTTTLGSSSAAAQSMQMITDFASKTPFQVKELTDSFVKLANQGFKPTRDEMGKLGDLAASTGKSFDQLAEGIIDAQVGEFERLKEFGIRASKQGDKVAFTFKGVKTEVDNTEDSIRNYITGLGEAEGVSGSMAAISETLGGKFSNLQDSYDQFALSLDNNNGIITKSVTAVVDVLGEVLNQTSKINNSDLSWWEQITAFSNRTAAQMLLLRDAMQEINKASTFTELQSGVNKASAELMDKFNNGAISVDELKAKLKNLGEIAKSQITPAMAEASKVVEESTENVKELTKEEKKRLELISSLKKQYSDFSQVQKMAFDPKSINTISALNSQLKILKDELQDVEIGSETFDKLTEKIEELEEKLRKAGIKVGGGLAGGLKEGVAGGDLADATDKEFEAIRELAENSAAAINDGVQALTEGAFTTMGEALGTALADGDVMSIGTAFMGQVADIVRGIGQQFIMLGTTAMLAKAALDSLFMNPALAIGAGVALVAVAAAMKSLMTQSAVPQMANGGLAFGESLVNVGEGRGTSLTNPEVIAPLDKLKQFMQPQGMGAGMVTFEIEADRLVGVMGRYNKQQNY